MAQDLSILDLDAGTLSRRIAAREVSCRELMQAALAYLDSAIAIASALFPVAVGPRIASSGRRGWSSTLAKASSSCFMRNPAAFCGRSTPTIELWARCAVPNASFT